MAAATAVTKKKTAHELCGYKKIDGTPSPPPIEKPPFTLSEIRAAIPPHCFVRSLTRSLWHLVVDIFSVLALLYVATLINFLHLILQCILWPIYWYVQGIFFCSLWVLAHECGHSAFSAYKVVNDTVGFLIHSVLLVPYFNWRTTHHKHHLYTSSIENDEIYNPPTRSQISQSMLIHYFQDSPLYNFGVIIMMCLIGWNPMYFLFNISGPKKYDGKNVNKFSTKCAIYGVNQWKQILLGDLGFFCMVGVLVKACFSVGLTNILFYYWLPYLVLNGHLVLVTFLHHTDTFVPHFRGEDWTFLRGALCTVDRSYGRWVDHVLHHIADTHVCHHLFPSMPFYHAQEATEAMKGVLGSYYLKDETPIWKAIWRANGNCKFVEDEGSTLFWRRE